MEKETNRLREEIEKRDGGERERERERERMRGGLDALQAARDGLRRRRIWRRLMVVLWWSSVEEMEHHGGCDFRSDTRRGKARWSPPPTAARIVTATMLFRLSGYFSVLPLLARLLQSRPFVPMDI